MIWQKEITLPPFGRGFHLVTSHIVRELPALPEAGLLSVLLKHTSAALTLNENADPDVRKDFLTFFDDLVPEGFAGFEHTLEGSDDMPAHLKSSLLGTSLTIPVSAKRLNMGTWQGIYLCEFRNYGGPRSLVLTLVM